MSPQDMLTQDLVNLLTPLTFRDDSSKSFDPASWYNTPGVSVAVAQTKTTKSSSSNSNSSAPSVSAFDTCHTATWGVKELNPLTNPVDTDTLFQACSVSKAFQSLAVLHYVSEGVITSLDDPIKLYLSETVYLALIDTAAARGASYELSTQLTDNITITQLLAHVAGTTGSGYWGYPISPEQPVVTSTQVLLGGFCNKANSPPVYINGLPGVQYAYSGGGSTILQAMLENIETRRAQSSNDAEDKALPYAALMKAKVLDPLGMTRSLYCDAAPLADTERNYARGYPNGHVALATGEYNVHPEQGAAGLWTTPADLVKGMTGFAHTLLGTKDAITLADGKPWIRRQVAQEILRKREELAHGASAYYCGFNIAFFDIDTVGGGGGGGGDDDDDDDQGNIGMMEKDKGLVRISHAGGNWGYRCWAAAVFPYSSSDKEASKSNADDEIIITAHAIVTNSDCGGEIIAPTMHAVSQQFDAPLDSGKLGAGLPFTEFPPAVALDPRPKLLLDDAVAAAAGESAKKLSWDAYEGPWQMKGRSAGSRLVVVTGPEGKLAVRTSYLGDVEVPLYAVAQRGTGGREDGKGTIAGFTRLRVGPLDVVLEFGWRVGTGQEEEKRETEVLLTMYTGGARIECIKV
ncbi:beta-lactamase/transpeptidase-like protein [Coniella lustricola]|uniref:Beta-lactamase/transpeptidase-like protein n=1 Tax=Coniella lustricola TaxID=2025994 RepID=A0A2T2ZWK6_9PEZI|nr:beta-lactamase/transpeptidase-like protein [Coniella lustricola]